MMEATATAASEQAGKRTLTPEDRVKQRLRTVVGCNRDIRALGSSGERRYFRVNFWRRVEGRVVTTHVCEKSYFVSVEGNEVEVHE